MRFVQILILTRYTVSGSCGERSGVTCYNSRHLFTFDAGLMKSGENILAMSLPAEAKGRVHMVYDALRLEIA